jgi:hypothetical protein
MLNRRYRQINVVQYYTFIFNLTLNAVFRAKKGHSLLWVGGQKLPIAPITNCMK